MMIQVKLNIFSPRWGHDDTYTVELDDDYMKISMGARETNATYIPNLDPNWGGESIHDIMNNDGIYPPKATEELFEHAWLEWRKGTLTDADVKKELELLADWINLQTKSKPNSAFWSNYF